MPEPLPKNVLMVPNFLLIWNGVEKDPVVSQCWSIWGELLIWFKKKIYEAKRMGKSMKIILFLYQLFFSRPFSIIQAFTDNWDKNIISCLKYDMFSIFSNFELHPKNVAISLFFITQSAVKARIIENGQE